MDKHKQWLLVVEIGFKDKVTREEATKRLYSISSTHNKEHENEDADWTTTGFFVHPNFKD